jgi:Kef-type K+ transport system membrane component KefB
MEHGGGVLLDLFVMFTAAKILAELCERIKVPGVIGEMGAGVLIGPYVLHWVTPTAIHSMVAQVGVVFLLFSIGLETKPRDMFRVGGVAALVAFLGVVLPFIGGFLVLHATGHSTVESIFAGAALVATSVGITARVLSDLGVLAARASRVILGAAVIDDVLGMLALAVVSSLAEGVLRWVSMVLLFGEALAFVVFIAWAGSHVMARLHRPVLSMKTRRPGFAFALIVCLGLSVAAGEVGMAAIIGAFLAGLALAEKKDDWDLGERAEGVSSFLSPFFFVVLGMNLDIGAFTQPGIIGLAAILTGVAIVGKLIGCGAGALGLGWMDSMRIGVGMIPRGEVGLIVALLGMQTGVISHPVYAMVIFMVVATTVAAPFALILLFPKRAREAELKPHSEATT